MFWILREDFARKKTSVDGKLSKHMSALLKEALKTRASMSLSLLTYAYEDSLVIGRIGAFLIASRKPL